MAYPLLARFENPDSSILALGASILEVLEREKTALDIFQLSSALQPTRPLSSVLLALDFLYLIGAVSPEPGGRVWRDTTVRSVPNEA